MRPRTAQDWLDLVIEAGGQQWLLRLMAVAAPVGAVLAASAAGGSWWAAGTFLVAVLAVGAAIRPDTHLAVGVVAVVVWRWLASVDDVTTPWLPIAAVCLLLFHVTIALAATIPLGAVVPGSVLRRWAARTAVVAAATVAVWVMVALLDRRDAPGNALLTGVALVLIALAAVAIRARSLPARAQESSGS